MKGERAMRKITAVLMALALALSLFACGGVPVQYETPGSDIQQGTVILPKPQEMMRVAIAKTGNIPPHRIRCHKNRGTPRSRKNLIRQRTVKIRVKTKTMHKRLPRTQSRRRIITIITVIMLQPQVIPKFPAGNTARYGSAIWSWAVC